MISEMIHSASLLHDDVIDQSDIRRGKPSVNVVWSQKKVSHILFSDFQMRSTSFYTTRHNLSISRNFLGSFSLFFF